MALITSHLLPPAPQCFEHPNLRIDDIYKVSSRGLQLQPLSTIPNHCSCERSRCER